MATNINPPPLLNVPDIFLKDRQASSYFRQIEIILFQLYNRTGGNTDLVSDTANSSSNGFSSQVQWLQQQINGLPEFTIDTTGFTTDTTFITTDKVIA